MPLTLFSLQRALWGIVILCLAACLRDQGVHSGALDDVVTSECAPENLEDFHIAGRVPEPVVGAIDYPGRLRAIGADQHFKLRLRVCINEANSSAVLTHLRVVYDHNYAFEVVPGPEDKAIGLYAALFGDTDELQILVGVDAGRIRTYEIKGGRDEHGSFVTAAYSFEAQDVIPLIPRNGLVVVGKLDFGDPFSDSLCSGREQVELQMKFGSLSLQAIRCQFLGGGQTIGYEYKLIRVTDLSTLLPEDQRGVETTLTGSTLAEALDAEVTHHNDNDSLTLNFLSRTYQIKHSAPDQTVHFLAEYPSGESQEEVFSACRYYWSCPAISRPVDLEP